MISWFVALPDWIKFTLILVVFFAVYLTYTVIHYNRVKKQILEMQNALKVGDMIMTQSGLYGTLTSMGKTTAKLKLAPGLEIVIDRFSIKNKVEKASVEE